MIVKQKEIKKLFWEMAVCENCNEEMIATGNYTAVYPPEYQLCCPKCGKTEFVKEFYPRMNFDFVEEVENV